jgi:mono/diheme cytochrome c family protein
MADVRRSVLHNRVVLCGAILLAAMVIGCDRSRDSASTSTDTSPKAAATVTPPNATGADAAVADADAPDPEVGHQVFVQTCATCHGFQAQGLPHNGAPLRTSRFVATHDDKELIDFIKKGRPIKDPANTTGVAMPPRGNNPALSDARLADVVAWLRQVQAAAKADAENAAAPTAATASTGGAGATK